MSEVFFSSPLISANDSNDDADNSSNYVFNELLVLVNEDNSRVYRVRHALFAKEIITQLVFLDNMGNEVDSSVKASQLTALLVDFIRESKTNTTVEHDTVIDVLSNLFIFRDRSADLNDKKFSPLIEAVCDYCNNDADKSNLAGRIFKTLVDEYSENAHFKAHLSRYYSRIDKDYQKGVIYAKEALDLAVAYGRGSDPILHHIYGMSLKIKIEEQLTSVAHECHIQHDFNSLRIYIDQIIVETDIALDEFDQSRTSNNQDAGYHAAIELCINILDFAKKLSGIEDTADFIANNLDAWYMKYLDTADSLMDSWRKNDDDADNIIHAQNKILNFYGDTESLNNTIAMWTRALETAKPENETQRRRMLVRAKIRKLSRDGFSSAAPHDIDEILHLLETNIHKEPKNSRNIVLWFDTIRYCTTKRPEVLLDEAIDKLVVWKSQSDCLEAHFYYFVCMVIKAIDGSSRAMASIPILQSNLKDKSRKNAENRYVREWLCLGKGLKRLKKFSPSKMTDGEMSELDVLTGTIEQYKNPGNAIIRSNEMQVFCKPKMARWSFGPDSIGARVSFSLGFSYDGLRALDNSVDKATFSSESGALSAVNKINIGDNVKCRVIENAEFYVNVKLVDYHSQNGGIHIDELGMEYTNHNRPTIGSLIYARVIGTSSDYWQLSLAAVPETAFGLAIRKAQEDSKKAKS
jgi:hypothetical protein